MDKLTKIESLSQEKLQEVWVEILKKDKFSGISVKVNCITANSDSILVPIKCLYITFPFQLSGNIDVAYIAQEITKQRNVENANLITIVSQWHISNGFQRTIREIITNFEISFIGRDELAKLVDQHFPDLWKHEDVELLNYENEFKKSVSNDSQLRKLKLPSEKCQRLLDIYISPRITSYEEDSKTKTFKRKRIEIKELLEKTTPVIISGQSGTGKSSLFKHIGQLLIDKNSQIVEKKNLPVVLTAIDILEHNRNIKNLLEDKLSGFFPNTKFQDLYLKYRITVFVDSIDEFDSKEQERILQQLANLYNNKDIRFFIGTREEDKIKSLTPLSGVTSYEIRKFNLDQIKKFVSAFFRDDNKANNLLEALRENKIIEKLPITPLTLSLISLLYDENDYEVPATITDVYDNFNGLIIGKAVVSHKIELIDVSFKERILSLYALKLLQTETHAPLTRDEFINYFKDYYAHKTPPIKGAIEDALEYMIHNTGILYLKDNKWVAFTHDSYMEYYAAVEIFKFNRDLEDKLRDNFYDPHWQNTAIFYAGKAKDMPVFLGKINEKLSSCEQFWQYLSAVQGAGYILQALYQTDDNLRSETIDKALDLTMEVNEMLKKIASDETSMFRNYKMPILFLINFIHFYDMFNSITLKSPLRIAFDRLLNDFNNRTAPEKISNNANNNVRKDDLIPIEGYKLLQLAFTLDSKRIQEQEPLEEVIFNPTIGKIPLLNFLALLSLDFLNKENYSELRNTLKKKYHSMSPIWKNLIESPIFKTRFSLLDQVTPNRKVKLLVEGKTDAVILEHAYMILTDGCVPYWKVQMATENGETGSAEEVKKALLTSLPYSKDYEAIIGIVDHDAAGLNCYGYLNRDYIELKSGIVKKHKNVNIYCLCIPVPGEMDKYLKKEQALNKFEIEHYFGYDFLKSHDMIRETEIEGIYEIKDSKKVGFAKDICKINTPQTFAFFKDLFEVIDEICNYENDSYII